MSDMKSKAALEKCLDQLGLHSMLRHYENLATFCNVERAPYEAFLLLLCERELRDREQRTADQSDRVLAE